MTENTELNDREFEDLKKNHSLKFIYRYIAGYDNFEDATQTVNISNAIRHALDDKNTKEYRAMASIDIITSIFFCLKSSTSEDGELIIHVPILIYQSARSLGRSLLLHNRLKRFNHEYSWDEDCQKSYLKEVISDRAAADMLYSLIGDSDFVAERAFHLSPEELDMAFYEAMRRAKSVWPYIDLRFRLPMSGKNQKSIPKNITDEHLRNGLDSLFTSTSKNKREYINYRSDKYIRSSLSRLKPVYPFIYAFYALGYYWVKGIEFGSTNYAQRIIKFTTNKYYLQQIVAKHEAIRSRINWFDAPPIERPEWVSAEDITITPLREDILPFFKGVHSSKKINTHSF